jgi:O-antigen/teichoic acid export membrane protein
MSFFRDAAGTLLTSTVNVPISIATSIVVTRWLVVEDRGLYSVAMSFATVAMVAAQLGWPSASVYRLRRMNSPPPQVATTALAAVAAVSLLAVVVCVAFAPFVSRHFLDDAPARVLYATIPLIPLQILAAILGGVARGTDRFAFQNWFQFFVTLATLVSAVIALGILDAGLMGALHSVVAAQAVCTFAYGVLLLRETGFARRIDWTETWTSLRFGLKSYAQDLGSRLHERVDIFMIAALLKDPAQVAFYAIASTTLLRLRMVPDNIALAAYPQLAALEADRAADFACFTTRHALAGAALMTVGVAVVAPVLVPLAFGRPYEASVVPLLVLLPGTLFVSIYRMLSRFFTALDRQQVNLAIQVIAVGSNVALDFWWIPRYGILGAAAGALVSFAIEGLLVAFFFLRATGKGPAELLLLHRQDLALYRRRLESALRRVRLAG